jgi:energy-coupling factor transporter ATP-binding protein EcfA2
MPAETISPRFPPALLNSSLNERLQYFTQDAMVEHPMLNDQLQELELLTAFPTSRNLILVIGPTGVGKSTLLQQLNERINSSVTTAQAEASQIGSVYCELRPPTKGTFDFSTMYREVLASMGALMVEWTRPVIQREAGSLRLPSILIERSIAPLRGHALEQRFYRELDVRRPRALILDEASAIFKIATSRTESDRFARLKAQADLVKAVANRTETSILLGGAYDFFDLSLSSGQNARRSVLVHIEPYPNDQKGIEGFAVAITSLLSQLPIVHSIDPVQASTELLGQGLGCVGTSAGILAEALSEAIAGEKTLNMDLVRKYYYSAKALDTMRLELELGAKRVNTLLTLADLLAPQASGHQSSPTVATEAFDSIQSQSRASKPLKPGDTKPTHMRGIDGEW